MEQSNCTTKSRITKESWFAVALCITVMGAWAIQNFIFIDHSKPSSPVWLPPTASMLAILGIMGLSTAWEQLWRAIYMIGLLFMIWAANKLLFDFLTMTGTFGDPTTGQPARVDWPGMISRLTAFAAAVVLARNVLKVPAAGSRTPASWYGYAAFILALPYPLLRVIWAFGGTLGITRPGAAGEGFQPLIIAIPWILAAILSLLLVSPRKWIHRRLLLFAGWTATAIVASIGPAAFWSVIKILTSGDNMTKGDINFWFFSLFYTSWFLWAIAGFAATRSYQLRTKKQDFKFPQTI